MFGHVKFVVVFQTGAQNDTEMTRLEQDRKPPHTFEKGSQMVNGVPKHHPFVEKGSPLETPRGTQ